jgi:hypothetical protein
MLVLVFDFFSNYLIEFMVSLLFAGLIFRLASYKLSVKNYNYFSSFSSEVEKAIIDLADKDTQISDVDLYLDNLLNHIKEKIPSRSVRTQSVTTISKEKKLGAKNVVSLRDYVHGEGSLFNSIKSESISFKSQFPPNYFDLADRVLEKDKHYNYILKFFPIAPVTRLINVLPGLFVVLGIFGTFIGISMALPQIAQMDFNNLDAAGTVLTSFVLAVTYAMKTSIAGILFSLIMTLLNTLAPIKTLRDRTDKKIVVCLESIWLAIHEEKSTEEEIRNILKDLLQETKNNNGETKKSAS